MIPMDTISTTTSVPLLKEGLLNRMSKRNETKKGDSKMKDTCHQGCCSIVFNTYVLITKYVVFRQTF
jgi:hypothetical protein